MDYSYDVIRSELIDIYSDIKKYKYLKKKYYDYRRLLLTLSDTKKKDNNGPLRYLSNRVVRKLKMWYNLSARYERRKLESSLYGVTLIHI